MIGTVASLVFGLFLMARGGGDNAADNSRRQNKLMAYRVYFQAAAIVVLLAVFYITKG